MDEPAAELNADEHAEPPNFGALTPPEDVVRGERTRDDFFDAVLALDSPGTASEVAALAGRGEDAAREYLEWFERMGIVTRVTESPATYVRNQEYLDWRRVQKLREEYTTEHLLEFLQTEVDREESQAAQFDGDSPEEVSIAARVAGTDRTVEDVWKDVSAWKTTRRRIALLERAVAAGPSESAGRRSTV